jgi:gamma-glutamyl hercynylcysteine S-oxide synthase
VTSPPVTHDDLIRALQTGRVLTLSLIGPLSDDDVHAQPIDFLSPLVWDIGHIAVFEDLWLVRTITGRPATDPDRDRLYDAFENPRWSRGELPLMPREDAVAYLADVRDEALTVLRGLELAPDVPLLAGGGVHRMIAQHESQHQETMLQAIELARLQPAPAIPRAERPPAPGGHTGLEAVEVAAGPCEIGAPDGRFAYDNERPRHRVEVPAFRIGRTPITNATFLSFVEGGGYERRPWWSDEAWAWKEEYDITHPQGWDRGPTGWRRWTLDGWAPLDPDEPVVHVSWFEADALARAHGARLPTEFEWEKAATWDQESDSVRTDGPGPANLDQGLLGPASVGAYPEGASPCGALGMLGDVWEWTSSPFRGYPGFVAHPYREYSEVFFGSDYKVLRGGSWATHPTSVRATFRNWDYPIRRQIFSGFRCARDAEPA